MKTVLVVDDDRIVHAVLDSQLKQYGYNPIHVESGEEFIELIESDTARIDAIILDIDLGPGLSGPECAHEARKKCNTPIIFHSSHSEKEILEKTNIIDSYGYVVKGTNAIVMDVAIKNAIRLHSEMKTSKIHENLYRTLFDTSDDAILILEHDEPRRFIDCNQKFTKIFGYSKEDVLGKDSIQLGLWADLVQREKMVEILQKDNFVDNFPHNFVKKNGEIDFGYLTGRFIDICDERFCVVRITQSIRKLCEICKREALFK